MGSRSTASARRVKTLGLALVGGALLASLAGPAVVMAAPAPAIDYVVTDEDVNATGNVLDNDTGTGTKTVVGYTALAAQAGTLTIATNGDFVYNPASNWSGVATTSYSVHDDTGIALGYVHITVNAVNDQPVAAAKSVTTRQEIAAPVTLSGTDVENSPLTYAIVDEPAHGTLSGTGTSRTYTPEAGYVGADAFTYTVNDGDLTSDPATVTVTVTENQVPVANAQSVSVVFEMAEDITLTGSDGDDDALTFAIASQPAHGVLAGSGAAWTYTPADGYEGADAFTFTVSDDLATSAPATVSLTIEDDAVAPVIDSLAVAFGTGRVNESAPLKISWAGHDDGVGIAAYEVQAKVGTGAWTTVSTSAAVSMNKFYPFGTNLQWQVRAKDANGNWSAWTQSPVRKLTAYQGASPVSFTGTWPKVTSAGSSGTGYKYTTTAGKKARLTFTGLGVMYVAPKLAKGGYARVKFDTASSTRVNLRASSTSLGVIIKSKMWSTSGSHTVQVWNDQGGRRTTFDAFVVLR